jgi:hypothetical protein
METDYKIKIECHSLTERKSCETCNHHQVCQYYTEIFDHHANYKHTIRNKRLINFVAEVCKYYKPRKPDIYPQTEGDIAILIAWARNEIKEYEDFIARLKADPTDAIPIYPKTEGDKY